MMRGKDITSLTVHDARTIRIMEDARQSLSPQHEEGEFVV